jgi:long-chain acyl-CoA synthetase
MSHETATSHRNLVDLYRASCRRFADRPVFGTKVGEGWSWTTYGDLEERIDAFRAALHDLGVSVGDRVAIVSNNRVEWAVAAYATFGLRATFVPMYEAQAPDEWRFILADSGARVVIAASRHVFETLEALRPGLAALEHVITLEGDAGNEHSYEALLTRGRARPVLPGQPEPDSVACFVYTSGTTGRPKGVLLTHANLTSNVAASASVFPMTPDDRTLSFLPWAHIYGQLVEVHFLVDRGASTALSRGPAYLLDELREVRPTMLVAVPRVFNRIYASMNKQLAEKPRPVRALFRAAIAAATRRNRGEHLGAFDALIVAIADRLVFAKIRAKLGGRMKYALTASAAIDPRVAEAIDAIGIEVCEGYGLSETSPVVSGNYPGVRRLGSVGKPLPGVSVTLDASKGHADGEGEIIVHGPNVMKGYHQRPDEDAKALLPSGGLRTGDLGRFDADGFLYVTGRIKEQYKLENGKYVMPSPIEERLKLSPYVANVMVHGENRPFNVALVVPDLDAIREWARRTGVVLADDPLGDPAVEGLIRAELDRCSESFKAYERPRAFTLVLEDFTADNGLLTPTLKLRRGRVIERHAAAIERMYAGSGPGELAAVA